MNQREDSWMRKFCSMGSDCLIAQISINTTKDGVTRDHEIIQLVLTCNNM
jgi:hypothetical protein